MSFSDLLNQTVNIWRKTDVLRATAGMTPTMSLDRQPAVAVKIHTKVSGGTTGSGTLTINGTSGGVSASEDLVFTTAGFKESSSTYTTVSSITESGFTNEATVGNLQVLGRTVSGQPAYQEVLQFQRKARITGRHSGKLRSLPVGYLPDITHIGYLSYDSSQLINEKDVLIDADGRRYEILAFDIIEDFSAKHHYELPLKRTI